MALKVNIRGLEKAVADVQNINKNAQQNVQNALKAFGLVVSTDAKINAPGDEGGLRQSISDRVTNSKVEIVVAKDYAAYQEFGTRKFAAQWISTLPNQWKDYASQFKGEKGNQSIKGILFEMQRWFRVKGIDDNHAYFIARKILTDGIRPKKFLYTAISKNEPQLRKDLLNAFK